MIRTTVALPSELLEAADRAVEGGRARSRNELLVIALRHEIEAQERAAIDAAFAEMAKDEAAQDEARDLEGELAAASWEALRIAEAQ